MKSRSRILQWVIGLAVITVLAMFLEIWSVSQPHIYASVESAPSADVAIILGAKVFSSGRLSDMLMDRTETAIELYRLNKVSKILVSGDHGTRYYDEVNAVKKYLLGNGIPPEDIFLDHAGFDTYDSMYRARHIFQVSSAIVTSQAFHLPRAVYVARQMGIESAGVSADRRRYVSTLYSQLRELPAKLKAYFDVALKVKPEYLGQIIPITGPSSASWDQY